MSIPKKQFCRVPPSIRRADWDPGEKYILSRESPFSARTKPTTSLPRYRTNTLARASQIRQHESNAGSSHNIQWLTPPIIDLPPSVIAKPLPTSKGANANGIFTTELTNTKKNNNPPDIFRRATRRWGSRETYQGLYGQFYGQNILPSSTVRRN